MQPKLLEDLDSVATNTSTDESMEQSDDDGEWTDADMQSSIEVVKGQASFDGTEEAYPPAVSLATFLTV